VFWRFVTLFSQYSTKLTFRRGDIDIETGTIRQPLSDITNIV
jgi:hypothetical protein